MKLPKVEKGPPRLQTGFSFLKGDCTIDENFDRFARDILDMVQERTTEGSAGLIVEVADATQEQIKNARDLERDRVEAAQMGDTIHNSREGWSLASRDHEAQCHASWDCKVHGL